MVREVTRSLKKVRIYRPPRPAAAASLLALVVFDYLKFNNSLLLWITRLGLVLNHTLVPVLA